MKTYNDMCAELKANGGILKNSYGSFYYKPNFVLHRENGPARESNNTGVKWWYYEGGWIMTTKGVVTPEQLLEYKLRLL